MKKWFEGWEISVRDDYLQRHLIPQNSDLWSIENFDSLFNARSILIIEKIKSLVPQQSVPSKPTIVPNPQAKPVGQTVKISPSFSVDKGRLREILSKENQEHIILNDFTLWEEIFGKTGCGKQWTARLRNELGRSQIYTIADLALFIMAFGLKFSHKDTFGTVYIFNKPHQDGTIPKLNTLNFGGWSWGVALSELEKRGFHWREFLEN